MKYPEVKEGSFFEWFKEMQITLTRHTFWICVLFLWMLVNSVMDGGSIITANFQGERIQLLETAVGKLLDEQERKMSKDEKPEWRNRSGGWVSPMGGVWIPPYGTDADAVYQEMNPELDPPKEGDKDAPVQD